MLAIGIRYLNGYVAAAQIDSRENVEWPPHPGRVFMAMAAAHFQTGADPEEREALLWLESEATRPPAIRAGDALWRTLVEQFVPVSDRAIWRRDPARPNQKPPPPLQSAPGIMRERQSRTFARALLMDDTVYLTWPNSMPPLQTRAALVRLCSNVTRIGHSSSLVQMWVANEAEVGQPNWQPNNERAVLHLRVAAPGTLAELERRYNANEIDKFTDLLLASEDDTDAKAKKQARMQLSEQYPGGAPRRLRPQLSMYCGYAPSNLSAGKSAVPGSVFNPHLIVLTLERVDGPYRSLDLLSVPTLAQRWREAILAHSNELPDPVRSLLSGHHPDGTPLAEPHLAFLPLAFVGSEHADGRLLGMALTLPNDVTLEDRRIALRAVAAVKRLALGSLGAWDVVTDTTGSRARNLQPHVWTAHPGGSTHWSTVTPIVFDRHPKATDRTSYQREVTEMIATACTRVGLPRPREVIAAQVSAHIGVPHSSAFPRLRRKDNTERRHSHAILVFGEPICGPILIGAGRFRGYGACRGFTDGTDSDES